MSIHYAEGKVGVLPAEERLLEEVVVRLIEGESEQRRHGQLLEEEHYLHNATAVGRVLRYVAEYRGQWVAILTFCSAALHLKPRDRFLHWSPRQVRERRHLIAQNSRFLILASTGKWPNLASRVLKLVCEQLPRDWRRQFGCPVLLVETFVDPQRFAGTCYRAANWRALGATQGFARRGQDYYVDQEHPKELWVYPLGRGTLRRLRAASLPAELQEAVVPLPPPVPISTEALGSLASFLRGRIQDPRDPHGVRHKIAGVIGLATVAVAAGCQGSHAMAQFAQSLNHGQRRRLGCRPRRGKPRQFDVPCERTFRRLLALIQSDQLRQAFAEWMATLDSSPVSVLHLDGKVLRNADPAPPRLAADPKLAAAAAALDTPVEQQKPKAEQALMLVNFQTPEQRLIDQIAVPQDTNEEAAVAAHLPRMDLAGVLVVADAAHTVKANCQQLTQQQGADFLFSLKANQPRAHAKAQQLLGGAIPPSGSVAG